MIVIIKKKTNTRIFSEEIKETLYSIDDYIKGNIKDYNVDIITLDCTEEDINNSLNESVVLRQHFDVKEDKVTVPVFFVNIEGVHSNITEYLRLLKTCGNLDNSLVINEINELLVQNLDSKNIINIVKNKLDSIFNLIDRKYTKYFIRYENKYDINMIIKFGDGNLSRYSLELQKYILTKLNDYINDFSILNTIEDRYKLRLLYLVSNLNDELIIMLNNYNVDKISPKIILLLKKEQIMNKDDILLLGFLRYLGMDIVIFSPAGINNLDLVVKEQVFSKIKLGNINKNIDYDLLFRIVEYLDKSKVSMYRLGDDFQLLGYNATIEQYKNKIRVIKYPALYKINSYIGGERLIIIGSAGMLISIMFVIINTISTLTLVGLLLICAFICSIGILIMDIK